MTKPLVIGFAGKGKSGKSFFANKALHFLRDLGYTGYKYAVAKPVYDMIRVGLSPLLGAMFTKDDVVPGTDKTVRHLLQTLGTEWGRDLVDPEIWVNLLKKRIADSGDDFAIVDDIRFPSEKAVCDIVFYVNPRQGNPVLDSDHRSENVDSTGCVILVRDTVKDTISPGQLAKLDKLMKELKDEKKAR